MQKVIFILYFAGLFLLISSYVVFSQADTALRLSVASSDAFASDRPNYLRVIARDLDTGSKFEGYSLRTCWRYGVRHAETAGSACHVAPLAQNGIATVSAPRLPTIRPDALCVALLFEGQEKKTACIDASSLDFASTVDREKERAVVFGELQKGQNVGDDGKGRADVVREEEGTKAIADDPLGAPDADALLVGEAGRQRGEYDVVAPGAFLFGTPSDVFLQTMRSGRPITSPVDVRQTYGQSASFPSRLEPSPAGISRLRLALDSAVDLEFTQDGQTFYASFSANDKPLHVSSSSPMITPGSRPRLTVTPFGNADRVVVDVFDGRAWVGHSETDLPPNRTIPLDIDFTSIINPKILFFRVSTSLFTNVEASQTLALIASTNALTPVQQAKIALDEAIDAGFSCLAPYLSMIDSLPEAAVFDVRDLSLAHLSMGHDAEITLKKRTEVDDLREFDELKKTQKSIANLIFIAWIAFGAVTFTVIGLSNVYARRRAWDAIDHGESPNSTKAQTLLRALHIALLIALFIVLAASLFYMMQIV